MNNQHRQILRVVYLRFLASIFLLALMSGSWAQNVPADLLNLSLEELFAAKVVENNSERAETSAESLSRWHFQYRYQKSKFRGYGNGSDKLSNDEVLFSPGLEPRTADNFPIILTSITQEVHAFVASYDLSSQSTLNIAVPYIRQSTDHISVIPGYDFFNIKSSGIGDVSVVGMYRVNLNAVSNLQFSLGLSFPTGSIDEKGDTPRAPGDQQLPYSMQLGSGTYDIPVSASYSRLSDEYSWGEEISAKLRLGKNDRNYRLGDRIKVSSWLRLNSIQWIKPSVTLSFEHTEKIHGADTELLVPSAFPFPAPVTNPNLYGGNIANLTLGFRFPALGVGKSIDLEVGKPIYQSLNGPQVREDFNLGVKYNLGF